jgi:hypothetical protein
MSNKSSLEKLFEHPITYPDVDGAGTPCPPRRA